MKFEPSQVMAGLALLLAGSCLTPCSGLALTEYDAPGTIVIDSISDLYGPVRFDHKRHAKRADCQDCHHHTTGAQDINHPFRKRINPVCLPCHVNAYGSETVACKDCHTKKQFYPEQVVASDNPTLYHIDKPGIKGAYHLACIPCHKEKQVLTSCDSCHALTSKGREFFHLPTPDNGGQAAKTTIKPATK